MTMNWEGEQWKKVPGATEGKATFEGWAIVELMGHRKLAGRVSEATLAGGAFLRLDVPSTPPATQFYAPGAVYCITPTTEEIARGFCARNAPEPITRWELPQLPSSSRGDTEDAEVEEPL